MLRRKTEVRAIVSLLATAGVALTLIACGGGDKDSTATNAGVGLDQPATSAATAQAPSSSGAIATPTVGTSGAVAKLNLNTASGSDFQAAIPNFPQRMVGEFLEYRPYVSIQQFRKEIGKYVSAGQVAEWEKYVYVPVDPNGSDTETLKQLPGVTDANVGQLTAARPYANNDAFLAKLASVTSQANASAAKAMLKA